MKTPIEFYFDFSSPYAYFGALRIDELAAKYDRQVCWHPILLGVIFKATESKPLVSLPMKGPYSRHDLDRTARLHQIEFKMPTVFPIATQQAARAMLWVEAKHGKDAAKQFAIKLFQALFVHDQNISQVDVILKLASECGLDSAQVAEGMVSEDIKNQLKTEVDAALAKGIFGAPFVIVDGEPFWGFDRFYQIEELLKHGKI
ncbi:2-hydroxychromene-2-carboxylate isomerase [Oxalobacteraceae bacterium GrIS 2.11]